MAIIRNSKSLSGKSVSIRKSSFKPEGRLELPRKPVSQAGELTDFSVLIHGEKKIGKTSLALQPSAKDVLVLQFDPPQVSYRRMEVLCSAWDTFRRALKELERLASADEFPYRRVVIDRCDVWFQLAQKEACSRLGITHPSEESWGKGWQEVRNVFSDAVDRILNLPCGKWFICHSDWKEVEARNGKIIKLLPGLTSAADEILNGKVDAWFAYAYKGKNRVLVVKGDERTGAGHRIDGHFRTPEGEPLEEIPMGSSPEDAYEMLELAFDNKIKKAVAYEDEEFTPDRKVKRFKAKGK